MAAASSSLPLSAIPPACTFACNEEAGLERVSESSRPAFIKLNMIFLIMALQARTKPENTYELCIEEGDCHIKRTTLDGRVTIMLGYQKRQAGGVWYTHLKDGIGFDNLLQGLKPLLTTEMQKLPSTTPRLGHAMQEGFVEQLKHLHFAPPAIVCDDCEGSLVPASDARKSIPTIAPPLDSVATATTLKWLLQNNSGLFLGHKHIQLETCVAPWLINSMEHFAEHGVKHLYLELDAAKMYIACKKFNSPSDTAELTRTAASTLDKNLKEIGVAFASPVAQICSAAKDHGIQVWAVDACSKQGLHPGTITSKKEMVENRDAGIIKNILYYSTQLNPGEKYIGLFGLVHHAVATTLHIPNLRITDEDGLVMPLKSSSDVMTAPDAPIVVPQDMKQPDVLYFVQWQVSCRFSAQDWSKMDTGAVDYLVCTDTNTLWHTPLLIDLRKRPFFSGSCSPGSP